MHQRGVFRQHYTSPSMTSYLVKKTQRIERFAEQIPGLRLPQPSRTGPS